jgi:hypothetical protein
MTRLCAGRPRISVSISGRGKRFKLLQTSRPALKPTPSSIQWILGSLSSAQSVWGVKLTNSIHLMRRLTMSVTIHSHPAHAGTAYRHFYLYFITVILQLQSFKKCSRFFGFSNEKSFKHWSFVPCMILISMQHFPIYPLKQRSAFFNFFLSLCRASWYHQSLSLTNRCTFN